MRGQGFQFKHTLTHSDLGLEMIESLSLFHIGCLGLCLGSGCDLGQHQEATSQLYPRRLVQAEALAVLSTGDQAVGN